MTTQVNSDGDFVENIYTELSSDPISASYDILTKNEQSVGSLAHEARKVMGEETTNEGGESDIAKWCDRLTQTPVTEGGEENDGSLGAMFLRSCDFKASEFTKLPKDEKYTAIPTAKLSETEYAHQKDLLVKGDIVSDSDTIHIPQTSNGDVVPIIACSDEQSEAHPTLEYATEVLETFINDQFGEVEVVEDAPTSDDASSDDNNGGSDDEESGLSAMLPDGTPDFTEANGIGDTKAEKLMEHMVREQVTVDSDDLDTFEETLEIETYDMSQYDEDRVAMLRSKDWSDEEIEILLSD